MADGTLREKGHEMRRKLRTKIYTSIQKSSRWSAFQER